MHVVVAGNHEDGRRLAREIGEGTAALKLPVARALRQIATDDDGIGTEIGQHSLERLHHRHVREPAEMHIPDVNDLNRHCSICTV